MFSERFVTLLARCRVWLLGAWVLHAFLLHYFVIGMVSWDGFTYRLPPVAELVQNGSLGLDKFGYWGFKGYLPVLELVHVPFLYLFGLPGLIIGYPLVVFPLCVAAVYLLVGKLTGDRGSATFGALAYAAIPLINQQPYSGYIDFAVCGAFAYFVYAVLSVPTERASAGSVVRLSMATLLFTMARPQGLYIVCIVFPFLMYALCCERQGLRVRVRQRSRLFTSMAATVAGAAPAIALQIWKLVEYGTPTYPVQFQFMGLSIGSGVKMADYYWQAGLHSDGLSDMANAFVGAWIWDWKWPLGGFFDGRSMGGGLIFPLCVLLLPVFLRRATRVELFLVAGSLLVSLLARDVVVPRYAYTFTIVLAVVIGRGMGALAASPRGKVFVWAGALLMLGHFVRPELDVLQLRHHAYVAPDTYVAPRLNVASSRHFVPGSDAMEPFPDIGGKFAIIETTHHSFILQIYGQRLTNSILGTVPFYTLGDRCSGLAELLDQEPDALVVDDLGYTRSCERTCEIVGAWGHCRAYRVVAYGSDRARTIRFGVGGVDDARLDGFRYAESSPSGGFRWTVADPGAPGQVAAVRLQLAPRAYRATIVVWGGKDGQQLRVTVNGTEVLATTALGVAMQKRTISFDIPAVALAADGAQRLSFESTGINESGVGLGFESLTLDPI